MPNDKTNYVKGAFFTSDGPSVPITKPAPIKFGQVLTKQTETLANIGKRMDAAKKHLDEIITKVRRS